VSSGVLATEVTMEWNEHEVEAAKKMYYDGKTYEEIGDAIGKSLNAVANKLSRLGIRGLRDSTEDSSVIEESQDSSYISMTTSTPVRTVEDALIKANVNTAVWMVDRFLVNSWEVGAKDDTGVVRKTPLWQVKLWLKRKRGMDPREMIQALVEELGAVKEKPKRASRKEGGVLAEISIMDHHFGKLAWAPEVGASYDLKIAEQRYLKASELLVESSQKANRILVVVGNDFFHVDRGSNQTTSGTQLEADGRWQKSFVCGCSCVRETINRAREIAPVDVLIVPGNHDFERSFTLGVVLGAVYENDERVEVHNSPNHKKRFRWGTTLLGFVHGHKMPKRRYDNLPTEMAMLWQDDWQKTTWREWHLGHVHSEHEDVWRHRASESLGTVIVRRLPSLCGQDAWHYEHGYASLAAAECHFYDYDYGRTGYRSVSALELES